MEQLLDGPTDIRFQILLTERLKDAAGREASRRRISMARLIREVLAAHLAKAGGAAEAAG